MSSDRLVAEALAMLGTLCLWFGWIVPVTLGAARVRRKRGGRALLKVGAAWGAVALVATVLSYQQDRGTVPTKPVVRTTTRPRLETFDPTKHSGATATITWPQGTSGELLLNEGGARRSVRTRSTAGNAMVRAGRFRLVRYIMDAPVSEENGWQACGYFRSRAAVALNPDSPHALEIGPPFTAAVSVQRRRGKEVLSLNLTDTGGNRCTFLKSGRRAPPPGFEILNEAGEVAFAAKFRYG